MPTKCPGCGEPFNGGEDSCFIAHDHIWCDVTKQGYIEEEEVMDRQQILEDLRSWLMDVEAFADEITAADVLEKLDYLEELYE